jgi:hypothetical protein
VLKNSILTKDNLLNRGWTGNEQCQFCGEKETINHQLFSCGLAKLAWQVIRCAFQLVRPPKNVDNMFGGWIKFFPKSWRNLVLCGAAGLSGKPEMMLVLIINI